MWSEHEEESAYELIVFTTVQLFTAHVIDLEDAFISGINFS